MAAVKPPSFWDPLEHVNEQPYPQSLNRVKLDIAEFNDQHSQRVFISPEEHDITKIHAVMVGAPGTPYEGGFFQFLIKCPPTYPLSPPRVRFMTTDAERVRFHIHLFQTGMVCLGMLGTGCGPRWTATDSLSTLLTSIHSLMGEHPYMDAFQHEFKQGDADRYHTFIRHETMRVAVCDQVEAVLSGNSRLPPSLREIVLKFFVEHYNKYEIAASANLHLTGKYRNDPILFSRTIRLEFETLFTRLQKLKQRAEKKLGVNG